MPPPPADESGSDDASGDEPDPVEDGPSEGAGGSANPGAPTPTATGTTTPPPASGSEGDAGAVDDDWDWDWEPGICGDALSDWNESCDDGNTTAGDGCGATCSVEVGYVCDQPGQPCRIAACGDGHQDWYLVAGESESGGEDGGAPYAYEYYIWEECDDGNTTADDGCSASCTPEPGWVCTPGEQCHLPECGDGLQESWLVEVPYDFGDGETGSYLQWTSEGCDDANSADGDGCSAECAIESGFACPMAGQACHAVVCGDGLQDYLSAEGGCDFDQDGGVDGGVATECVSYLWESCDDGNLTSGDGCDLECTQEEGWICEEPGTPCRKPVCGDDLIDWGYEECEDGNDVAGDGCSATCMPEAGWACEYYGSCHLIACGDGFADWPQESCDDGNLVSGDGCSETCVYEASECDGGACFGVCGDGVVGPGEQCDDGMNNGGGCTPSCTFNVCGDGVVGEGEQCDDGNSVDGDACSNVCQR